MGRYLHCRHCRQRCDFASDSRVRSVRCDVRSRLALQSCPGCASVRHEKHTALLEGSDCISCHQHTEQLL